MPADQDNPAKPFHDDLATAQSPPRARVADDIVGTPVTKKRDRHAVSKVPRSRLSHSSLNLRSPSKDTQDKEENTSKKRRTRSSGSTDLEAGLPYKPSPRRVIRPSASPSASHPLAGQLRQELSHSYRIDSPGSGSSDYNISSDLSINSG